MSNSKLLSSLSYFSVFFAPLLLPIIIYFVADEFEVRRHAKKAFVSHIVPMALLIAGFIVMSFSIFSFNVDTITNTNSNMMFWGFVPMLFIILYSLLFVSVLIWNVYQGVKVLK
ncbi:MULTISPECIES: hypothetical protein [Sporosarcina]|uniref:DUF4870 domain-containing protein n=1 Tax=Sporosarcina ureae TaxID=1571 RepID=A0ABM6JU07_SPOUR|nr:MULTISPECIES: hypothetical protein [Sporosarcina]ARF13751.1 hypothetical protein SporoS204_06095 [Sporosarcina ureae]PIC57368.1 hypothetical protein CSV81_09125 [Sporosarcina sp. P10]PIC60750.1 hypothetical protein CSV80_08795 [Sporosarcina sp. P12(2017)]PIC75454.1 hypothetical protein CSV74_16250 [Sporosarcina sp. P19]